MSVVTLDAAELLARRRNARSDALYRESLGEAHRRCDRMLAWLLGAQWICGMLIAIYLSPLTWHGRQASIHPHVWYAFFLGGLITLPAIATVRLLPGRTVTRHAIAVSQMLWSALLIHLTGGRIETHFHVFGSLAFLAFYRDWKVVLTATLVVGLDHLIRGLWWPETVYGITNPEWWRFLEHVFWVLFEDVILVFGIVESLAQLRALAVRQAEADTLNESVEQLVVERTAELAASREQYRSLLETTRMVPWTTKSVVGALEYVGPQGPLLLGCSAAEWSTPSFWAARLHPDDVMRTLEAFQRTLDQRDERDIEFRLRHDDGGWVWTRCLLSTTSDGRSVVLCGVLVDVTEQRVLAAELQQAQKLESVGQLASGIAHEINTPVQFVSDSVHFLREAFEEMAALLTRFAAFGRRASAEPVLAGEAAELGTAVEAADLDYLVENVPKALDRSLDGLSRVATLVRSMKEFAHPDQKEKAPADINHALQTTLEIARNEYKYVATIETDFQPLPQVYCHIGQLNQVFLNVIVNAAHAIGDVVKGTAQKGVIRVATRSEADQVVIAITDSGRGIPEAIRPKIFDPFFTTKAVGKGTGQGLAIARSVVTDKHAGTLTFETQVGSGTTFFIRLPVAAPELAEAA